MPFDSFDASRVASNTSDIANSLRKINSNLERINQSMSFNNSFHGGFNQSYGFPVPTEDPISLSQESGDRKRLHTYIVPPYIFVETGIQNRPENITTCYKNDTDYTHFEWYNQVLNLISALKVLFINKPEDKQLTDAGKEFYEKLYNLKQILESMGFVITW